jgi:ribosomal-protein-alanine N-acetyltransferase
VGPFNDASIKLVHNFGFQREGYMREHYYREGIHEDSILYSLLKSDFEKAYPCMP